MELNWVTEVVIGAAMTVHRDLGPGLLESVYQSCLASELDHRGLSFERQVACPLRYRGVLLETAHRTDLLIETELVVELKTVDRLMPVHEAQLLTYLRFMGCTVGLLMNFNVDALRNGIRRVVSNFPEPPSHLRSLKNEPQKPQTR